MAAQAVGGVGRGHWGEGEGVRPLVIYHSACYDGFTAAWVAHKALGEPEMVPARYGEDPPDVAGRDVYIVDFSYPRDVMVAMHGAARSLRVLDHHKTAREACAGLEFCEFDMDRSGAGMAWDHFYPHDPRPLWVDRIEDRDLWRFRYDDTEAVYAFVASQHMTLKGWDEINSMGLPAIVERGSAISGYIKMYCSKASNEARLVDFQGHRVVALNTLYLNASETAHVLLKRYPDARFSLTYYQDRGGRWGYSLRSRSDFDVSAVAKKFGGGGHAQAAGFGLDGLLSELGGNLNRGAA